MVRLFICLSMFTFFIGCTNSSNVVYEAHEPAKIIDKEYSHKEKRTIKKELLSSGMIKGIVIKAKRSRGLWHYEIRGDDTSNNKLQNAKFTSKRAVMSRGDFVYVVIENSTLKEVYLFKKANFKNMVYGKIVKMKRVRKYQLLELPAEEFISF